MRVRAKICGVTTPEAVAAAVEGGADAVGFVFAESPRQVTVEMARALARTLPPFVARVAVFRHPDVGDVERICTEFAPDVVQSEPTPELTRVLPEGVRLLPVLHDHPDLLAEVKTSAEWATGVLLEAPGRGGRGVAPNRERARQVARHVPLVLAGGLDPSNVAEVIDDIHPYGVDVSSGVERAPGIKDPQLIGRFLRAVRDASGRDRPAAEMV